jgi:hypothetical protein
MSLPENFLSRITRGLLPVLARLKACTELNRQQTLAEKRLNRLHRSVFSPPQSQAASREEAQRLGHIGRGKKSASALGPKHRRSH